MQFLHRLRHGQVRSEDMKMLKDLIITSSSCPPTDFDSPEWGEAALVTPRHSVRTQWNDAVTKKHCERNGVQLFICPAEDHTNGRPLTSRERLVMASKRTKRKGQKEKGGLPDEVKIALGMKVMVTVNVQTELDVTNGTRGEIVDIILHPDEPPISNSSVVRLQRSPAFVLVKLGRTRMSSLEDLQDGVIPIEPMSKTVHIEVPVQTSNGRKILRKKVNH
ncbi:uncharacterized protein LAESUDRAFT_796731 [Laetiporus sulphureus 93-53]|uniref:Uncharacterized protein n=1 Tax=Laetiporus sulphureus 93-53 TaxID=1314785 RepID=A0A165G943_9APHY|nr:uncharacterized protein LAESUDRAFT_796731 [Laetiporus sulphureus 93-53]KZT10006.1 hypothetical protein LAESUDRAFT_796731 [Laetiporus sulphureus 93-53]